MASCFESNKGSLEDLDGRCDGGAAAAAAGSGCGELSSCALAMMEKEREPLLLSPSECPGGTLGSTTPTSLLQGQADVPMQGYDVEFDPPLESKYECPICLMALRNAIQTPCGHRFCKNCIEKSIRDTGQKCPVDNEMLLEEQLFPDNFAKREILSLRVRCPNAGCADKMELRSLDNHVSQCQFATLVCPQCHQSVRKSQLEEHQSHQCLRRPVECQECMASFVYEDKQLHERQCPFANVECEYCGMELIRDQMESHCDTDCPKAPIACTFSTFGCRERMQRHDLAQHMQEFTQMHMRYMAEFVRTLSLNTASLSHQQSYGLWPPGGAAASSSSSVLFPGEEHGGGGATACGGGGGAAAAACGGVAAAAAGGGAGVASCSGAAGGGGASAAGQPSEEAQRLGEMDRRLVKQDHQLRELIILKETQVGQLAELKRRVATLEDTVRELEAQQCQGIFVWRLKGFAAHLRNQEAGLPVVEHSPGFYTGRPGYKLCLRLHLQSPNAPRCSNYISLFVHTMQGAFDGQLSWPFQGTIRLAVLDQGAEGQHHMEVMETKPDLQAFQKPTIMRNPKGFGYVTFLHLQQLSQRGFVKDDTLLVRCEVTPRFGGDSPAGSLRREGAAVQPRGPEASVLTT